MANQENTCSESGSCANSVKAICLSLVESFKSRLYINAISFTYTYIYLASPGHRYDEPGQPNDQSWGGYGKCRLDGESAAASFPLLAVSVRPRGLTQ